MKLKNEILQKVFFSNLREIFKQTRDKTDLNRGIVNTIE